VIHADARLSGAEFGWAAVRSLRCPYLMREEAMAQVIRIQPGGAKGVRWGSTYGNDQ